MQVKSEWQGGLCFTGLGDSGHEIATDASREAGGEDRGVSPLELLLHGIAGCMGIDIVKILDKKQADIDDVEIEVSGERADDYPRKFDKIEIDVRVTGSNMSQKDLEQAVSLSHEKYCSASNSIAAEQETSCELIEE